MDETTQNPTQEQTNEEHQPEELQGQGQGSSQKASLFDDGDETQTEHDVQGVQDEQQDTQDVRQALTADDIKLPEGYEYDKDTGDSFLAIANEAKLSKETVQKLIEFDHARSVKMLEAMKAAEAERSKKFEADMAAEKAEWLKQCKADKEYGGQNWEASQAVIDRAAKAHPEAVKVLQAYNLHYHPEIVRMFFRDGKLMGEDQSRTAGGAVKETDPATAIFGESLKEFYKRRGDN